MPEITEIGCHVIVQKHDATEELEMSMYPLMEDAIRRCDDFVEGVVFGEMEKELCMGCPGDEETEEEWLGVHYHYTLTGEIPQSND